MLKCFQKIDILSAAECKTLLKSLKKLAGLIEEDGMEISPELEDCHTAIESYLVENSGEAGHKIHTGRSRNDQVLTAVRLYMRNHIVAALNELTEIAEIFLTRFDEIGELPMPGYTHMQPAMPASVGMWLHSYAEGFIELIRDGLVLLDQVNSNPLGAASGFGVPLPLDREFTAKLLGFTKVQRNPIHTQNSRGRFELKFIRWAVDIGGLIEKFSSDLILYTAREFGFFSLPEALTTGSSIMPQKHNPDVIELLRARAAKLRAAEQELLLVIAKLPSNYHRDFQYTKEPLIRTVCELGDLLAVLPIVASSFSCNEEALEGAMTDDLYATYAVYREVRSGTSFREAYRKIAALIASEDLDVSEVRNDFDMIDAVNVKEAREARKELEELQKLIDTWTKVMSEVCSQSFYSRLVIAGIQAGITEA